MVGGILRTGMTVPSSWDVTFNVTLFSIDPINRRSILNITTGSLDKIMAVYIQATLSYLEIAVQDASGVIQYPMFDGVGTPLTLGTPMQVKVSRRGLVAYVYYNGIQQSSRYGLTSVSSIGGASLYMGTGANISVQNLVYQPMVSCAACSAGTYAATPGSTACLPCLSGLGPAGSGSCTFSQDAVLIQQGGYYDIAAGAQMAYYPFNPTQALVDASGSGRSLTQSSSPPTAGVPGPWPGSFAASFTAPSYSTSFAVGQFYYLPSFTILDSFSVCLWFNTKYDNASSYATLLFLDDNAIPNSGLKIQQLDTSSVLQLRQTGRGTITEKRAPGIDMWGNSTWVFVCVAEANSRQLTYYVNGTYVAAWTPNAAMSNPFNASYGRLGVATDGTAYLGQMAQVRMFNRTLSVAEMDALYNFRGDVPSSPVVAAPCPAGYECPPNNKGAVPCVPGAYAPALETWLNPPLTSSLLTNIVVPDSWDLSFNLSLLSVHPTQRMAIVALASTTFQKLLSVSQPAITSYPNGLTAQNGSYLEVAVTDAAGTTQFVAYAGSGAPPLPFGTWTMVTCSRRGTVFKLYYNGTQVHGWSGLSNTSSVQGVSLMTGNPAPVTFPSINWPMANCTIQNLTYLRVGSCMACPAGGYSLSSGSSVCMRCAPGYYSNVSGATASNTCLGCGAGTYSTGMGATACVSCSVGTYSTVIAANSSSVCTTPATTTSSTTPVPTSTTTTSVPTSTSPTAPTPTPTHTHTHIHTHTHTPYTHTHKQTCLHSNSFV